MMERLTFEGNFCDIAMCDAEPDICGICDQRKVWERLKAYEDTGLEPEDFKKAFNEDALLKKTAQYLGTTPDRLHEWAKAEQEDRLVVLPCKVGDTVYSTLDDLGHSYKCEVTGVYLSRREHESYVELDPISYRGSKYGASFGAFGKTVFLTREEAEAALAGERKDGEG
jgi:hypothetical protein